jgi:hypothetical protein
LSTPIRLFAQQKAPDPDQLPSKEPFIQPSEHPGYKLVVNTGKSFGFEIPDSWGATHNGAKTDGYYVVPPKTEEKDEVVIAVSRAPSIGNNATFLKMLEAQYGQQIEYSLYDGSTGYHFENAGTHTEVYARLGQSVRLLLSIEAPDRWRKQHRKALAHLAKSLQIKSFQVSR